MRRDKRRNHNQVKSINSTFVAVSFNHTEIIDQLYFEKQYQFVAPHIALSNVIEYYWQLDLRGNCFVDDDFAEHIFANLNASMVFNLGTAFTVNAHKQQQQLKSSVLIGHHTETFTYKHFSNNFLTGIKFKPAGINLLFGISSADLNNHVEDATYFLRNQFIEEQLLQANTFKEQTTLLDTVLLLQLNKQTHIPYKTQYVCNALHKVMQKTSFFSVDVLAQQLHVTKRSLERYFKQEIGVSPKQCLSILRFRQALKSYGLQGSTADYEALGFYDFSHFMKDYKRFTTM
ncbi:MAG: helix-turn-helix domain-containing protein [Bacteroidota bacterium]